MLLLITGSEGLTFDKIGSVRYQHPYIISLVSAKPGKILPSVKKIFFLGVVSCFMCTSTTLAVK